MKRWMLILTTLVVLLTFLGTLWFLYAKGQSKPTETEWVLPETADIVRKTVATGAVEPRREIALKSRISGVVEALLVTPGDNVEKGDIIARIRVVPDMLRLNTAESQLAAAEIRLENAHIELERFKKLATVVAESEILGKETAYRLAAQERRAAKSNVLLVREGVSAEGQKVSNLVRATISGTVLDLPVDVGGTVIESNTFNDGTTIASVADMNDMVFRGFVDESEVGKLKVPMPLSLRVGALDEEEFSGGLEYISPKGELQDGAMQFELRAALKLKDGVLLRSGYSANADIELERRDQVLGISEAALIFEGKSVFAEVQTTADEYEKREIKVGLSDGMTIEVISGLTAEDKVRKP